MRVALYARVACEDQLVLDWQVESLTRYAADCGYEIVEKITDDGVSGFKNEKSIEKMLRLAQEGRIDAILCRDWSRISRDCLRMIDTQSALNKLGIPVKCLPLYERNDYVDELAEIFPTMS